MTRLIKGPAQVSPMLFSPASLQMTVSAAASSVFRDRIRDVLRPHAITAKENGELREDLDPDAAADWLVRIAQMLLMEHMTDSNDAAADRRTVFRDFVIPGLLNPRQ